MAEIQLTDALTGRTDAYTLAVIDWDALIDSGVTPFSGAINAPTVSDTNKTFYYIDNVPITDEIITGMADSMLTIGTAPAFKDNFLRESSSTYLPDYTGETVVWFWKEPIQNVEALEAGGTFTPNRLYYKSETACRLFRTDAGGLIGGSIGVYDHGAQTAALCCIGAAQTGYVGGFYQQGLAGYCPRFDGDYIIDFSTHPTRTAPTCSVGYDIAPTGQPLPNPTRLHAQMLITIINNVQYLGLAAVLLDALGKPERLSVLLIPSWFWGQYTDPEDPAATPQYHGLDATTERESGTYSYQMSDITLPTNPQPYSRMVATEHGLHVYSISHADYDEILGSLWGDGGLAESLWRKFRNYKFNPIAGVLACHIMPDELMPTSAAIVQVKAAGCPLMSVSSAHDITAQAYIDGDVRTLSIPKYFSSHLNYDPYSAVQLFLPFCGWMPIAADRVVGGSLSVQYRADVVTGNVVALVRCFDANGKNTATYQASGNAALSIPITGNDNGVGTVIGAVTASAGLAAAAIAGVGATALVAGAAGAGLATQTARNALQMGTQYSGNVAALGCLQPFVLVTMPVEHTSEEFRHLHGLPSGLGMTVGQLAGSGYTEMSEFHAEIDCISAEEQQEIESLMMGGVIL